VGILKNGGSALDDKFVNELDRICDAIAELLRSEAEFRAEFALDFAKQVKAEPGRAQELYDSWYWWGGMGSMFDFTPEGAERNRLYCQLLVDLARLFELSGFHSGSAAYRANILEDYLRSKR
jgi:hypothetical protein